MRQIKMFILSLFIASFFISCQKNLPLGDYDAAEVGKIKKVSPGVVLSLRPVRLHQAENPGITPNLAAEGGEFNAGQARSHGVEYVVKLNSGTIISIVQAENIKIKARQHVLVIYGTNTRIVPDNGSDDI